MIAEAPSLFSPNFRKDFILYTFTSDSSLATVLTQKESDHEERPISLMIRGFQGAEINYLDIDK